MLCDDRSQGVTANVARCTGAVATLDLALPKFSMGKLNLTGILWSFSDLSVDGVGDSSGCCEQTGER